MNVKATAAALVVPAALALGPGAASVRARATEPKPVCERVLVQERSGAGPTYYLWLCGTQALPVTRLVVDGSMLPERSTAKWAPVAFWSP